MIDTIAQIFGLVILGSIAAFIAGGVLFLLIVMINELWNG